MTKDHAPTPEQLCVTLYSLNMVSKNVCLPSHFSHQCASRTDRLQTGFPHKSGDIVSVSLVQNSFSNCLMEVLCTHFILQRIVCLRRSQHVKNSRTQRHRCHPSNAIIKMSLNLNIDAVVFSTNTRLHLTWNLKEKTIHSKGQVTGSSHCLLAISATWRRTNFRRRILPLKLQHSLCISCRMPRFSALRRRRTPASSSLHPL